MPIVTILNAPAGAGKDTIARIMASSNVPFKIISFKEPLFAVALGMTGISREEWFERYDNRELKEKPWSKLNGMTQRQFLIKISEEWTKPTFGDGHFGKVASRAVQQAFAEGYNVVFSDGGFIEEVMELCKSFGNHAVRVARLHRKGFAYGNNDSRDYIYPDFCGSFDLTLVPDEPVDTALWLCRYVSAISDVS